jgi:hypothetical protein
MENPMRRHLAAAVAVLAVLLLWDNVLSGMIVGSAMAAIPGMKADYSKLWETVGDVGSALVFAGLYARVRGVFGMNLKGGVTYGVYAGLLMNFPTWLNMTVYAGWPYGAAWTLTIALVVLFTVAGAVMGVVYQSLSTAKTG